MSRSAGFSALLPTIRKRQYLRECVWPHTSQADRNPISHHAFAALRQSRAGQRCYIIGSAPSITTTPIERIADRYVFLLNRAYLLRPRLRNAPNAHVIANPHAMQEYGAEALAQDTGAFFFAAPLQVPHSDPRIAFFSQWHRPRIYNGFFSWDPTRKLHHGTSVAFNAIAIARWMGFDEIVLAGVDFNFAAPDAHFYESSSAEARRSRTTSMRNAGHMMQSLRYISRYLDQEGRTKIYRTNAHNGMSFLEYRAMESLKAT